MARTRDHKRWVVSVPASISRDVWSEHSCGAALELLVVSWKCACTGGDARTMSTCANEYMSSARAWLDSASQRKLVSRAVLAIGWQRSQRRLVHEAAV